MSGCAKQIFSDVSPAAWQRCKAAVAKLGVAVNADNGSASGHGLTIAWDYDQNAQTLSIQCTDRPFFPGCDYINGKIHQMVEDCLNPPGAQPAS